MELSLSDGSHAWPLVQARIVQRAVRAHVITLTEAVHFAHENVPCGACFHNLCCEWRRNIYNMKPSVVTEHVKFDLHNRWMNGDERELNKSQQKTEQNKARRDIGVHKDYEAARLVNDRARSHTRQRKCKTQVRQCEFSCVVAQGSLADHRKTNKNFK
jgi:hypothetical protein